MTRPRVQIHALNLVNDLRCQLETFLPKWKALPGVVGITLNGGMSRGYADHLSEIDVTLYLRTETYTQWQSGRSPIPLGIVVLNGALYDIKIVDIEVEKGRAWESDTLWDASYAEILHDPERVLAALFKGKLAQKPQPQDAEGDLFHCWWYFRLAGDIWIHREDALQGHLMLNQAVIALVRALFLANREFVPHEKWLIHMSRSLEWKPLHWEDRLSAALSSGNMSLFGLKERQTRIEQLWDEIDAHIRRDFPGLPVRMMQKTFYDLLRRLVEKEAVPLSDWQAQAGLAMLNSAPFYGVARIDQDYVRLNPAVLLETGPEELYAWHYEVLDAARSKV
jgi:hypothetical protein